MILRVTDKADTDISLETIVMTVDEFSDIANHPFIATNNFDALVLDLDKRIPFGFCKAIVGKVRIIPKFTEVNTDTIRLLSECFPDYAALLRTSFMRDKEKLTFVLTEMRTKYLWDDFQ